MYVRSPIELGLLIKQERKKLGLSQAEVGKLVGLRQQTISEFEDDPQTSQIQTLFKIIAALNLNIRLADKNQKGGAWKEEW